MNKKYIILLISLCSILLIAIIAKNTGQAIAISEENQFYVENNEEAMRYFLEKYPIISQEDIYLTKEYCEKEVCFFSFEQRFNEIPVYGSELVLITKNNQVVHSRENILEEPFYDLKPSINKEEMYYSLDENIEPLFTELIIYIKEEAPHLAWFSSFTTQQAQAYSYVVDAHSAEILEKIDHIHQQQFVIKENNNLFQEEQIVIDGPLEEPNIQQINNLPQDIMISQQGEVIGGIYPEYFEQQQQPVPFSQNNIHDGQKTLTSDKYGKFSSTSTKYEAKLEGPFIKIINYDNKQTVSSYKGGATIDWRLHDSSKDQQESNAFWHTNVIQNFFSNLGFNALNYPFEVRLGWKGPNRDSCQAISACVINPQTKKKTTFIHLFPENQQCKSYALWSDVIYHEYTHSVICQVYTNDLTGKGEPGGMNEGLSDYFATTINGNSCYQDIPFHGRACQRQLKNTLTYPKDFSEQQHDASRVFSASLWDLREKIGATKADKLIFEATKLQPKKFEEFIKMLLIVDDTNSDLKDGTPHIKEICLAFAAHGLKSPYCSSFTSFVTISSPKEIFLSSNDKVDIKGVISFASGKGTWYLERNTNNNFPVLLASGTNSVKGKIATIDTKNLLEGEQTLTITIKDSSTKEVKQENIIVYVLEKSWPKLTSFTFASEPVVADINNDGKKEIVIGDYNKGYIYAFNSEGKFIQKWPNLPAKKDRIATSPIITDINNDKQLETIVPTEFGTLAAVDNKGEAYSQSWPFNTYEQNLIISPVLSNPLKRFQQEYLLLTSTKKGSIMAYDLSKSHALFSFSLPQATKELSEIATADINNDQIQEFVIAAGGSQAKVYLMDSFGTMLKGWPKTISSQTPKTIVVAKVPAPILVDINNDNTLEIFISSPSYDGKVYGFDHLGNNLKGWPQQTQIGASGSYPTSLAVADLDKDGDIEIVVGGSSSGLYAWHHDGKSVKGYPLANRTKFINYPLIGDIDQNKEQEIIIADNKNQIHAYHINGTSVAGYPKKINGFITGYALDDSDNDGFTDITISTVKGIYHINTNGKYSPQDIEWGTKRNNLHRTGTYR